MLLDNKSLEQVVYSMFCKSYKKEYMRLLIDSVYHTIKQKDGITVNSIKHLLNNSFAFEEKDIDTAIALLTNNKIFGSVSKFEVTKYKSIKPIHLRAKDGTEFWKYWISHSGNEEKLIQNLIAR